MSVTASSNLIEFADVSFAYGDGDRRILDKVSFVVPRGKVVALMGASGGGKTTVLRLIGGQRVASHGKVLFDGHDVGHMGRAVAWACCSSSARCSPT
jgi:phospholipid/cholesterol/gamma-HCH transport system ATP-binding protein